MKGTFFQRPLELSLQVNGESWTQGESITGILTVKNHGAGPLALNNAVVHLAYGNLKSVREKIPGMFKILSSVPLTFENQLEAQQNLSCEWCFESERNAPITDKSGSLFLLYGTGTETEKLGHLQLVINPDKLIQEFIKTMAIQFRFVVKSQKANKGQTETKLTPPSAQGFASLEHLMMHFRYEGETLEIRYVFNVKKIEATAASFDLKKQKKELTQTLTPSQAYLASGRVNHDHLEALIRAALDSVESKILF